MKDYLKLLILFGLCLVGGASTSADAIQEYNTPRWVLRWGGPGFDDNKDQRFAARITRASDSKTVIVEIKIDSKETAYSLERVRLTADNHLVEATSLLCRKISRHETAPYGCQFAVTDIKMLPDELSLIAYDDAGRAVLKERISIAEIRQRLLATMEPGETSGHSKRAMESK